VPLEVAVLKERRAGHGETLAYRHQFSLSQAGIGMARTLCPASNCSPIAAGAEEVTAASTKRTATCHGGPYQAPRAECRTYSRALPHLAHHTRPAAAACSWTVHTSICCEQMCCSIPWQQNVSYRYREKRWRCGVSFAARHRHLGVAKIGAVTEALLNRQTAPALFAHRHRAAADTRFHRKGNSVRGGRLGRLPLVRDSAAYWPGRRRCLAFLSAGQRFI